MKRRAKVSVPAEPTLDMCIAYMRALRFTPRELQAWTSYLERQLGTPHECGFVAGLRAAIAVGAGLPVGQVGRGRRPVDPQHRSSEAA